jgi:transcriptional regulator with XRE-family HTH domain
MPTASIQKRVGARVRELRKARGWTLEQLADKAEKHYTYIGGLERGDRNVTLEVLNAVAAALEVPLRNLFRLDPHPLEEKLNAPCDDILTAINSGFRATIDAKGKIAELYLHKELQELAAKKVISDLVWFDGDGKPDFELRFHGRTLRVECKNIRSLVGKKENERFRVELQKTRNSKDGAPTRGYPVEHFDILSVCLFNRTRQWRYLHISSHRLARRVANPKLLEIMQMVPVVGPLGFWKGSFDEVLKDHEASR